MGGRDYDRIAYWLLMRTADGRGIQKTLENIYIHSLTHREGERNDERMKMISLIMMMIITIHIQSHSHPHNETHTKKHLYTIKTHMHTHTYILPE